MNELETSVHEMSEDVVEAHKIEEINRFNDILSMEGTENAYQIHRELGEIMTDNVTVVRYNDKLEETLTKIKELRDRFTRSRQRIQHVGVTKGHRSFVSSITCST